MAQVLMWLVFLLPIALIPWALVRENDRRRRRTVEEWERDHAAGQGKMSLRAPAWTLISEKREAIQYRKDEQQGMTKTGTKGDEADRTAVKE